MITLVVFVVLALATARITRIVSRDDITTPQRLAITRKLGDKNKIVQMIWCHWCSGWWIAGLVTLLAALIAVAAHQTTWWLAALMWLIAWPAVAYAGSWIVDREVNDGVPKS